MQRALKRAPLRSLLSGLLVVAACGPVLSEPELSPAEEHLGAQESALCAGLSVTSVTLDGFSIYEGVGGGGGGWTLSTGANAARVEYFLNGAQVAFEERMPEPGTSPASGPWYFSQSQLSCGAMYTFTAKVYPMVIDSAGNRTTCLATSTSVSESTSEPCPSPSTPSRFDTFARGPSGSIYRKYHQSDLGFSGWQSLGAPSVGAVGDPTAVSRGSSRIDLFVRGGDNALWQRYWDGSTWSAWVPLGGGLSSGPDATSWGSGRLDVFALGTNGNVYQKYFQSGWSGWSSLGAPSVGAVGDPTAVSWGSNRIDLFVRGGDNALWQKYWNGSTWSAWVPQGGVLTSTPDVASWGPGHLDVFARGANNVVMHKWFSISGWSEWRSLGAPAGGATSAPGAVSSRNGYIDLVVRGADNAIWRQSYNGFWSGWESLGGVLSSGPDAASWSN